MGSKKPLILSSGLLQEMSTDYLDPTLFTRGINTQTGTSYTTVLSDANKLITSSNSSPQTITIPLNSSVAYPIGTVIDFMQLGTGKLTIAITATGNLYSKGGNKACSAQYVTVSAMKVGTDTWVLIGDLAA